MNANVRREILKDLPEGARVYYIGPSVPLSKHANLVKVCHRSNHMRVSNGKKEFRIKYFNLTCDDIRIACQVRDKINYDPDALPF